MRIGNPLFEYILISHAFSGSGYNKMPVSIWVITRPPTTIVPLHMFNSIFNIYACLFLAFFSQILSFGFWVKIRDLLCRFVLQFHSTLFVLLYISICPHGTIQWLQSGSQFQKRKEKKVEHNYSHMAQIGTNPSLLLTWYQSPALSVFCFFSMPIQISKFMPRVLLARSLAD